MQPINEPGRSSLLVPVPNENGGTPPTKYKALDRSGNAS